MKKILASIFTIFATGALTAGVTGAWMNGGYDHGGHDFNSGKIDLKIDHSRSIYDGLECKYGHWRGDPSAGGEHAGDPCKEWDAKDLGYKDKFYLYSDIKPGDWGRDIISLHVNTKEDLNACVFADNAEDKENGRNEPEKEVDGSGNKGELSKFLKLFAWNDLNGNGDFDPRDKKGKPYETKLYKGLMKDFSAPLTLEKKKVVLVGTAWCAGTQTVNMTTGEISCDGSGMGNIAQTDSMRLELVGYAEAKRWYSPLTCGDVSHEYHDKHKNDHDEHDY